MAARAGMVKNRQLNIRTFVQPGGALPGNQVSYLNKAKGQLRGKAFTPAVAGKNQIVRPSDDEYGTFQVLGRTESAPDLGTVGVAQDITMNQLTLLEEVLADGISLGLHFLFGTDKAALTPNNWESKLVIPDADMTGMPLAGDFQGDDSDEVHMWNAEFAFSFFNRAVRVAWQNILDAVVLTPVVGVAFGNSRNKQYALLEGDGTAVQPILLSTSDGWVTSASNSVSVLAFAAENPNDLAFVGDYLIAPTDALSYVYAAVTDLSVWTEVATGFVATKIPNAVYAPSLIRTYFAANGGYIYLMDNLGSAVKVLTDGTITTQHLTAIDGLGETVVAVGGSNAVVRSLNGGGTFALVLGPAVGVALTKVQVLGEGVFVVGDAGGNLWYTVNGHETTSPTWVALGFTGSGAGSITGLKFFKKNPAFGLLAHKTAAPVAEVYRTTDAGNTWEKLSLTNFPVASQCDCFDMYDANTFIAGGKGSIATDGELAIAKPSRTVN